jgi:hypothetical protein
MRCAGSSRSHLASWSALFVACLVAAACGRDSGPAPSPPPTTGGDGGPPPAGNGNPAPSDGSPAPGDGMPAPGGSGGGAGSPGDPCAGLAPTFGDAVELRFDTGTHSFCSVATTSASGQVALGISGPAGTSFALYTADGNAFVGEVDGNLQRPFFFTEDVDPWFHPTGSGYQGIVHPGILNPLPFRSWDVSGRLLRETERFSVSSAPDRNGGSLLLARVFDPSNDAAPPGPTKLEWLDASGEVKVAVTLDRDPLLVLSSWATGHAVVVVPGTPGSARWFDESGTALTPWFDVGDLPTTGSALSLHLLLDGTVAISSGGRWQVALPDAAASPGTVPGWLAARPSTRLATIRQGRAYAVLPAGPSPDATRLEIVTGSGESCGSFSIPPAPVGPGQTKAPQRLDVGQDGTLLQTSSLLVTPVEFGIHCTFRWWPAVLK